MEVYKRFDHFPMVILIITQDFFQRVLEKGLELLAKKPLAPQP